MDKISVIGKIGDILSDLQKQQQFFSKNHESLNEVDAALFAASANFLAEYAKVLKRFPVKPAPGVPSAVPLQVTDNEDDDIGFRLSAEEDEKKIQQVTADSEQGLQVKEEELRETVAESQRTAASAPREQAADRTGNKPEEKVSEPAESKDAHSEERTVSPAKDQGIHPPEKATHAGEKAAHPAENAPHPAENAPHPAASQDNRAPEKVSYPENPHPETETAIPETTPPAPEHSAPEKEEERHPSLNERYQEKSSTLYEKIAPQHQQQSPGAPISNLGRSIGINERYYFIKTLFNDDKVSFDQAITRIDMCGSLGEALEYVSKSLAGKFGWGRKEEDSRKFYELLKRRFV